MDNSFVGDKQEQKIQDLEQQVRFWKSEYENLKIRFDALEKKLIENEAGKVLSSSVASLPFGLVNSDDTSDSASIDSASVDNLKITNEDDEPETEWAQDEDYESCPICASKFHAFRRRHHCRRCGRIFCSKCSSHFVVMPGTPSTDEQRCCDICYNLISQMKKLSATP